MLEQMADEFRPILSEKSLSWEIQIAPDLKIICDAGKLERVFDNLFRNAVNYSYPGSAIHLALSPEYSGVRICVKNHGKNHPAGKTGAHFRSGFSAWILPAPAPQEARGWGWPSPKRSWSFTAEKSLPRAQRRAWPLPCCCQESRLYEIRKISVIKSQVLSHRKRKHKTPCFGTISVSKRGVFILKDRKDDKK